MRFSDKSTNSMTRIALYFLAAYFGSSIVADLYAALGDDRKALSKCYGKEYKIKGEKEKSAYFIQLGKDQYSIVVTFENDMSNAEVWQRIDRKKLTAREAPDILGRACGVTEWKLMKDPDQKANDTTIWLYSKKDNFSVRITPDQVIVMKGKVNDLIHSE